MRMTRCTYLAWRGALNESRRKFNGGSHTAKSGSSIGKGKRGGWKRDRCCFGVEDPVELRRVEGGERSARVLAAFKSPPMETYYYSRTML